MKRTLLAIALAGLAATAIAADDAYRTNAGESDLDNFVQIQLGDASDAYRNNAGESTEDDVVQTQLG
jgi:hypothetical protein